MAGNDQDAPLKGMTTGWTRRELAIAGAAMLQDLQQTFGFETLEGLETMLNGSGAKRLLETIRAEAPVQRRIAQHDAKVVSVAQTYLDQGGGVLTGPVDRKQALQRISGAVIAAKRTLILEGKDADSIEPCMPLHQQIGSELTEEKPDFDALMHKIPYRSSYALGLTPGYRPGVGFIAS